MELLSAERLETRARADLAHAMNQMDSAISERARRRHARRAMVAAERLDSVRQTLRELSGDPRREPTRAAALMAALGLESDQ